MSDAALLQRWTAQRDAYAFKEIVGRYAPMVYATCARVLRNEADAEDLTQECFEILLSTDSQPRDNLGAWFHRVATNRALDRLRSDQHRKAREESFVGGQAATSESVFCDMYEHVDAAIAELPEELRVPVVAHFLENKTHIEIARTLGLNRRTVMRRIAKGLENITASLKRRGCAVALAALTSMLAAVSAKATPVPATLTASLGKLALAQGSGSTSAATAVTPATSTASGTGSLLVGGSFTKALLAAGAILAVVIWGAILLRGKDDVPSAGTTADGPTVPAAPPKPAQAAAKGSAVPSKRSKSPLDLTSRLMSGLLAVKEASSLELADMRSGPFAVTGWVDTPGATVVLVRTTMLGMPMPPESAINAVTVADEYGSFTFSNLPRGRFVAMAFSEDGFAIDSSRTDLFAEVFLELRTMPTQALTGRVVDEDGRPVGGAVLYAHNYSIMVKDLHADASTAAAVVTEPDGTFYAPYALPGKWRLWVLAEGYATALSPWLETGKDDNEIVIKRGATLQGTVVDASTGAPLAGLPIVLSRGDVYRDRKESTSGTDGIFRIEGLQAETYELSIGRSVWANKDGPVSVTVAEGQPFVEVAIPAAVGGVLGGRVYDVETGEGIPGVRLMIASQGQDERALLLDDQGVYTDGNGVYSCQGLAAGECRVYVENVEGYPAPEEPYTQVGVQLGEVNMAVDVPLEKGIPIQGRVVDIRGNPASLVTVEVRSDTGTCTAVSKPDGTFLCAVPLDSKEATFSAEKHAMRMRPTSPTPLPAEGLTGVMLRLDATATVAGTVVDGDGNPISNLAVTTVHKLQPHQSNSDHVCVGPDGSFRFTTLLPGPTLFYVGSCEGGQASRGVVCAELDVKEGEALEGVELVYKKPDEEAQGAE